MENSLIKSTIAVHGKYYAFRLAEGLSRHNVLDKIYTLYPKFKLSSYKIPPKEIKSFWPLGGLKYLNSRLGSPIKDRTLTGFFDDWTAFALSRPSKNWIFNGYSGFCEKSLIKAKKMGAVTLVERACPHIDEQENILREEQRFLLKKDDPITEKSFAERMKREYEITDYVVVPSNYSRQSFIDRGFPESKILAIPLCNEKAVFKKSEGFKKNLDEFKVLCVGGNFYRKGIYYLLLAWKELNLKKAKLIIKGEVPSEFSDLVKIPGVEVINNHLTDAEINDLYNDASVFVLPSIDDGFGMVVVEAMATGLPVIVTKNVGAADILKEGEDGFVVPVRDVNALKERIMFFYKNPEKIESMGKAAFLKAKNYSPESYCRRVIDAYEKIFI